MDAEDEAAYADETSDEHSDADECELASAIVGEGDGYDERSCETERSSIARMTGRKRWTDNASLLDADGRAHSTERSLRRSPCD